MDSEQSGKLILEKLPNGVGKKKALNYLHRFYRNAPGEKVDKMLSNLPAVLSNRITRHKAGLIINSLKKLGASAKFKSNSGESPSPSVDKDVNFHQHVAVLRHALMVAFEDRIEKPGISLGYKIGLFISAFFMLLLPLLYVGLVAAVGLGVVWHAVANTHFMASKLAFVFYIGPLIVGAILVFFMIKPLLVSRRPTQRPLKVDRRKEPFLFETVEKICRLIGAPVPSEIYVDTQINASAGFGGGIRSLFSSDLVLTIGLPLVSGLSIHQMASVLAHEFGHFSQSAGMRLWFIIRSVNIWFERLVYEEDEWDEKIRQWEEDHDLRHIAVFIMIARLFVWLSRKFLWVLMMLGHAVSCYMSRQMEYDADGYSTAFVGPDTFKSTDLRINELAVLYNQATGNLWNMWQENRLIDDFPELVRAGEKQIREIAIRDIQNEKSGIFHTHPTSLKRIGHSAKIYTRHIFNPEFPAVSAKAFANCHGISLERINPPHSIPATILFDNFRELSKKASVEYYSLSLGRPINPSELAKAGDEIRAQDMETEFQRASGRFFLGQYNGVRPLKLSPEQSEKIPALGKCIELVGKTRTAMQKERDGYAMALKRFSNIRKRVFILAQAELLLNYGFTISPREFGLSSGSIEAIEEANRRSDDAMKDVEKELAGFEKAVRIRLIVSIGMLGTKAAKSKIEKSKALYDRAKDIMKTVSKMETEFNAMDKLNMLYFQLMILLNNADEENRELIDNILSLAAHIGDEILELRNRLNAVAYPFQHTDKDILLGEFIVGGNIPTNMPPPNYLQLTVDLRDRFYVVYSRLAARLAYISEIVESSLITGRSATGNGDSAISGSEMIAYIAKTA